MLEIASFAFRHRNIKNQDFICWLAEVFIANDVHTQRECQVAFSNSILFLPEKFRELGGTLRTCDANSCCFCVHRKWVWSSRWSTTTASARRSPSDASCSVAIRRAPSWGTGATCWPTPDDPSRNGTRCRRCPRRTEAAAAASASAARRTAGPEHRSTRTSLPVETYNFN